MGGCGISVCKTEDQRGKGLQRGVIFGSCLNKRVWAASFCPLLLIQHIQPGPVLGKGDIMTGESLKSMLLITLIDMQTMTKYEKSRTPCRSHLKDR